MIASALLLAMYVATAVILLLLGLYCLQIFLTIVPWPETTRVEPLTRLRFAVLIPAHNEQAVLGHTLMTLLPTLGPKDRVLVVADNCTDSTALIARQTGAEVIERREPARVGKAYALDFGLKHLQADNPDAVIFLDADCQVQPDTIRVLGTAAVTMRRPAQGLNLSAADSRGGPSHTISNLAFRFKNLVRVLGLSRLTGSCYLTGRGMALPWNLTHQYRLADDDTILPDRQLGLNLTVAGHAPLLVPYARVDSPLPQHSRPSGKQNKAPKHGYLRTLLTQVPRLLYQGTVRGRPDVIGIALDMAIPPIALLTRLWLLTLLAAFAAIPFGGTAWPALFLVIGGECLLLAVVIGWFIHCRKVIRFSSLCALPFYLLYKLPFHLRSSRQPQADWAPTERDVVSAHQTAARPKRA